MHVRRRRAKIVLTPILGAGASIAVIVLASCSSPDPTPSAAASSPPVRTSSPAAITTPTPSTAPPSPTQQPTARATTTSPERRRVHVVTTFAGWNATSGAVEVGGYAAIVEPVGVCALRLTLGTKVVTQNHPATADATTVACGGFTVPKGELAAGQWQAVLAYSSSTSAGESAAVMVKVP